MSYIPSYASNSKEYERLFRYSDDSRFKYRNTRDYLDTYEETFKKILENVNGNDFHIEQKFEKEALHSKITVYPNGLDNPEHNFSFELNTDTILNKKNILLTIDNDPNSSTKCFFDSPEIGMVLNEASTETGFHKTEEEDFIKYAMSSSNLYCKNNENEVVTASISEEGYKTISKINDNEISFISTTAPTTKENIFDIPEGQPRIRSSFEDLYDSEKQFDSCDRHLKISQELSEQFLQNSKSHIYEISKDITYVGSIPDGANLTINYENGYTAKITAYDFRPDEHKVEFYKTDEPETKTEFNCKNIESVKETINFVSNYDKNIEMTPESINALKEKIEELNTAKTKEIENSNEKTETVENIKQQEEIKEKESEEKTFKEKLEDFKDRVLDLFD